MSLETGSKDHSSFILNIKTDLRLLALYLISIPAISLLLLVRIFVNYRIAIVRVDRLGHLALNMNLFFRRYNLNLVDKKIFYILITPSQNAKSIANRCLLKLYKRYIDKISRVHMLSITFLYEYLVIVNQRFNCSKVFYTLEMNSNEKEFSYNIKTIEFSEQEIEHGYLELKNIGIDKKQKIVCVFARDNEYLKHLCKNTDWSYHDYRNADIDTYIPAIKFLISKGYTVVRIGSVVSKRLELDEENFIDYPYSNHRSDFLDIFLISISNFVVSSSSGSTDIAWVFNIPYLGVNYAPFSHIPLGKNNIFIQKKVYKESVVPYKSLVDISFKNVFDGKEISSLGLKYIENTAEEILEAVVEMESRTSGVYREEMEDIAKMKKYFHEYLLKNTYSQCRAKLARNWLKENEKLYF